MGTVDEEAITYVLSTIARGDPRERLLPLLLLADESLDAVRGYMNEGSLYAYAEADAKDTVVGLVLAVPHADHVELKAVAVDATRHGEGHGSRMLRAVLDALRADGVARVVVGTGNAGIGQLAFYQKAGFRLTHIERDFFSSARGYPADMQENGIALRDMVWMDQRLIP